MTFWHHVGIGSLLIGYITLAVFSVIWLANAGEMASIKPASWVGKAFYWHGVFVLGSLMLGAAMMIAMVAGTVWRVVVMGGCS